MIHIGICDDEVYMLDLLEDQITDFFHEAHVAAAVHRFASGTALLETRQKLDLLFLDIQMNGPDGLTAAKTLRSQGFDGFLIYVTVLQDYVFDAFETQPFDYLVKPLKGERFTRTMTRLLSSLRSSREAHLLIHGKEDWHLLPFGEIVYCEIINRKVFLHLKDGTVIDYYEKLSELEKKLDQRFFRCHRSYLVNLQCLKSFGSHSACLTSGDTIPVSRLRSQALSDAVIRHMQERRAH